MKHIRYSYIKFGFIFLGICSRLIGVDFGSDTAVTRFNTQQSLSNTDRIAGFAHMFAGFVLTNTSVTATFDSVFPVSGNVSLTHGTLILNQDLIFTDVTTILELGNITGNLHNVSFAQSVTCIPSLGGIMTNVNMSNVNLLLNQDVYWPQQSIHFSGNCSIDGDGHSLTLAPTCSIIVDANSSLMFKDIVIENVDSDKIQMADLTGTISFDNAQYILDGNFTMTHGKIVVMSDFTIAGEGYTFAYLTDQISTISTDGRLILDNNVTFSFVPRVSSRDMLNLLDSSSELVLRGATFYTTTTGLRLTTGRLVVERASVLYNQGTRESEAISFADTLAIQVFSVATLDFNGLVVYE